MAAHKVKAGECIETVALEHGRQHQVLLGENPDLSKLRENPNVLAVGDEVVVEPPKPGKRSLQPGVNKFVRLGSTSVFRAQLFGDASLKPSEGAPALLKDQPFELEIDGKTTETGVTDADGRVEVPIPTMAASARLLVGDKEKSVAVFRLSLGFLEPESEELGVQGRLRNMGYNVGEVDGILGPRSRRAIEAFQRDQALEVSGEADDKTRTALEEKHGC